MSWRRSKRPRRKQIQLAQIDGQGKDSEESSNRHQMPSDHITVSPTNLVRSSTGERESRFWPQMTACHLACLLRCRGVLLTLTSAILLSISSLTTKFISGNVSANVVNFFCHVSLMLYAAPILVWTKTSLLEIKLQEWKFLFLRAVLGTLSGIFYFHSLALLDLSTAKSVFYLTPIFTAIFASLFLKESCSLLKVISICVSVVGILFIVQPNVIFGNIGTTGRQEDKDFVLGVCIAVGQALVAAFIYITLRKAGKVKIDVHLIMFVFGAVTSSVSAVIATAMDEWRNISCGNDRLFLLLTGITCYLEVSLFTIALRAESTVLVSVLRTTDVVFTFALDIIILKTLPNIWTILGSVLVVASSISITIASYTNII
ncbi:solute carrier family 35 member G1-like [Diadema antillarum]|uniref:solute carrier family 35 member G1-like n=1 Tax=Diadema antillarum TaxID=105358 RepID=UPI003A886440